MRAAGCGGCGAVWLELEPAGPCPGCGREALDRSQARPPGAPERFVPFAVDRDRAAEVLGRHLAPVRFPVDELDPEILAERLCPVWWPMWLVDARVRASWEAEVGFDYEVNSSVEMYGGGGWSRREVRETRIRWERRAGTVAKSYDDLPVPALVDAERRARWLGPPPVDRSRPWDPSLVEPAALRLPDRAPEDQWPAAVALLRERIGADCARAAGAQHLRGLQLELAAEQADWTWLLLPGWTTWYEDDEGGHHVLWVDGATGRVGGPRMASVARGRTRAVGLGLLAAMLGLLAVGCGAGAALFPPLVLLAGLLLIAAAVLSALAIQAATAPDRHNRSERARWA